MGKNRDIFEVGEIVRLIPYNNVYKSIRAEITAIIEKESGQILCIKSQYDIAKFYHIEKLNKPSKQKEYIKQEEMQFEYFANKFKNKSKKGF